MNKRRFTTNFLVLTGSMFVLYFLAVGLAEPAGQMLRYMNDATKTHPPVEWAVLIPSAIFGAVMWCGLWIAAKRAEKICVDELNTKQRKTQRGRKK